MGFPSVMIFDRRRDVGSQLHDVHPPTRHAADSATAVLDLQSCLPCPLQRKSCSLGPVSPTAVTFSRFRSRRRRESSLARSTRRAR